jgi:RluA family pseudouridine synthase
MSISEKHIVGSLETPQRIYDYLPGRFKTISTRKGIKKAFSRKQIFLNGKLTNSASYVKCHDTITLEIADTLPSKPYLKRVELLYEDDYLAAFCKPPGLVVSGNQWKTLENAAFHILKPSSMEDRLIKPQACHRIDAMTGGIVIFAKTYTMRRIIGELFKQRVMRKTYLALVHGLMNNKTEFKTPISGKKALTQFAVMSETTIANKHISLLKCYPITGRKHQIRIHLSENGNPIVGDKVYGVERLNMDRKAMYLFSYQIEFNHPVFNKPVTIKARPPKKMRRFIANQGA